MKNKLIYHLKHEAETLKREKLLIMMKKVRARADLLLVS